MMAFSRGMVARCKCLVKGVPLYIQNVGAIEGQANRDLKLTLILSGGNVEVSYKLIF